MPEERRLAAIMFTDMVGYTALMGRDAARARELVTRARSRIRSQVEHFHGQWLDEVGDGTLSAFPSAVEAVECALAIQDSLHDDAEIRLRIGIHLGDVVFTEGRVYGDGVNVASRIEALARPGGIAVSEAVASAIRGHKPARMSYLGRKRLKNVDEPVRVYALALEARPGAMVQGVLRGLWERRVPQALVLYALAGAGLVWLAHWFAAKYGFHGQWVDAVLVAVVAMIPAVVAVTFFSADPGRARRAEDGERRWSPARFVVSLNFLAMAAIVGILLRNAPMPGEPVTSLAVLPFTNLSGEQGNDYFSDGLTDELISTLGRIEGLNVAARSSSFMFKNATKDIEQIAGELGVRHILDGSVRKAGDQVRISVQLVDAGSGYNVWQQTYEKKLDDIFAVQADIARTVVSELDVILSTRQIARLARAPTDSMEAYNFYLQGLEYLHRSPTERHLSVAESLFRSATTLDADFASAHSGLCQVALKRYELTNAPRYIDIGESTCQKAMELDESLHEVRIALGNLYMNTGRLDEAERLFRAVIAEAPLAADAWVGLGRTLDRKNAGSTTEAESALRRAVSLQPADWSTHLALGDFLYWRLRYGEALQVYRRLTELMPENYEAWDAVGATHLVRGELDQGISALEKGLELSPSRGTYRNLGLAHYYSGNFEQAIASYRSGLELEPDDHWTWGELGDVLRHSGKSREARDAYASAASLARAVLERGDEEPKVMARLALYLLHLDKRDEAGELYRKALARAGTDPEILYYAAQYDQMMDRPDEALEKLETAVDLGFPPAIIAPLPDFESLRASARFQRLVAQET